MERTEEVLRVEEEVVAEGEVVGRVVVVDVVRALGDTLVTLEVEVTTRLRASLCPKVSNGTGIEDIGQGTHGATLD